MRLIREEKIKMGRISRKESNNLDEVSVLGIDEDSNLKCENFKELYEWILSLKPNDVRDEGISKKTLWNIKHKIRNNENFKHKSKPLGTLRKLYIMK